MPKMTQKNFRIREDLVDEFNEWANENLADQRAVVEALLVHWVQASPTQRTQIIRAYNKWREKQDLSS